MKKFAAKALEIVGAIVTAPYWGPIVLICLYRADSGEGGQ